MHRINVIAEQAHHASADQAVDVEIRNNVESRAHPVRIAGRDVSGSHDHFANVFQHADAVGCI